MYRVADHPLLVAEEMIDVIQVEVFESKHCGPFLSKD
jgi:hypothetical protein